MSTINNYSNIQIRPNKAYQQKKADTPVTDLKNLEFKNLLNEKVSNDDIKLSNHAEKRLKQRNINLDSDEFLKIKNAVTKLNSKGGKDSLVITDKAAYVVDVNSKTVVTAVDKNNLNSNVFTNIDSTIFAN